MSIKNYCTNYYSCYDTVMKHEQDNPTVTTGNGEILEITRGGNIFTNKIIFERPDLLVKCPKEIQQALKLYHTAINLLSVGKFEESRKLMEQVSECLLIEEIN